MSTSIKCDFCPAPCGNGHCPAVAKAEKEFIDLSWRIIEAKIIYYRAHGSWVNLPKISDTEYDNMELKYLGLCKSLNKVNYIVHKEYPQYPDIDYSKAMVEVDFGRPSVLNAYNKLFDKYSPIK